MYAATGGPNMKWGPGTTAPRWRWPWLRGGSSACEQTKELRDQSRTSDKRRKLQDFTIIPRDTFQGLQPPRTPAMSDAQKF